MPRSWQGRLPERMRSAHGPLVASAGEAANSRRQSGGPGAGWSLLLLSLFYLVIDVWKFRKGTIFFTVIGANSILIYIAPKFLDFEHTNEKLFGGISHFAGNNRDLLMHASYLGMLWFLLYFLYRKKIFLKV